jgi:hypothetical protein
MTIDIHSITTWDPSAIGMTPEEKSNMDDDEQRERMIEEINRAADIMQAVVGAFGEHMRPTERVAIWAASEAVIRVARECNAAAEVG